MGRFGWLRLASRPLTLRSSEVSEQRSILIRLCTPCSSSGTADRCYGRSTLTSSVPSRFFHSTGQHCSMQKDYYKILDVPKDASQDDIKKAFHSLAKKYHPDTNRGNTAVKRTFQEIRDAYETLRDPSKRQQYDMLLSRGSEENFSRGRGEFYGSSQDPFSGFNKQSQDPFAEFYRQNNGPFSSKFYKIFSEVFQHDVDVHANDIEVEVNLSFSEAAKGCTKQVPFSAKNLCNSCDGRGYLPNARKYVCPSCKGEGRVSMYPFTSICTSCRGFGKVIKDYCLTCKGSGVLDGMKYVNVTIPAGVDSGDTIHVPEAGNSGGHGALPGSLYIKLRVASDPVFVRDGADIHVDKKISFTQAMLGGKIEVPTLDGKTQVKIPKGVQPGQVVVLRGKGLPNQAGYTGDQYVRFRIHFPLVVNERQRALLEEFAVEEAIKEQSSFAAGNWLYEQLSTG
ncbi:chaperone protein dnaJ 1, mitochondrial isoform X2 [Brachypodium distachyon]|uniref:chaperone protein dnaJ 1, mitochondrial isoform X2 n=1 Tax=Brachypodium distachyon TaxID=15368 RepID=UPI00052FFF64|nr:chaperone protein dnaJ 1, mitochondrial isoform X2 [Brachypodium distachyon]|eukprot:XP_010227852.1 chaperone protein dnaJ 1, mitochondrial isoform X2 [Brachypodium distachyon]